MVRVALLRQRRQGRMVPPRQPGTVRVAPQQWTGMVRVMMLTRRRRVRMMLLRWPGMGSVAPERTGTMVRRGRE